MPKETIQQITEQLLCARDEARLTDLPSQGQSDFTLEQGYQIGLQLHRQMEARGYVSAGRKIGFTNPATWEEFDLDTPIWAHMYSKTVHFAERDRFRLSLAGMAAPRIEPEIVIKLKAPLTGTDLSTETICNAVEWVAIGFEVVDSHFPDWCFTAADAVADFGVHAALVVGTPWPVTPDNAEQLIAQLPELNVTLRQENTILAEGKGSNALGSPLLAVGFLAAVLENQPWAPSLANGEIITTGTLTQLPYVHSGEQWRVQVAGLPLAALEIELID